MYYKTNYLSPIGVYTVVSDGENLTAVSLVGQKYYEDEIPADAQEESSLAAFKIVKNWFDRYFSGERISPSELQIKPSGNEFRTTVWKILSKIKYGELITYGEVAKKVAIIMNKPKMSAQAVGGAVGHNPVSIIIPCHRVIGANGHITGYAGGINIKIKLLTLEGHKVFLDKI